MRKIKKVDLDLIIQFIDESIENFINEDKENIDYIIEEKQLKETITFDHYVILSLLKSKIINKLSELYDIK